MKIRPSVAIIENGNVLLMRYEYGGQTVYNLPGGNAEHLETLKEGVERELVEELNLVISTGMLLHVGETHKVDKGITILHLIFEGKILSGTPKLNPEHTSALAVEWVPLTKLSELNLYPNVGSELLNPYKNDIYGGVIKQNWF
ncbi:MAG: hypothetical protein RLZZ175_855 [Bacteroidota bacterium]|jgi:8-oxo-dGTP diphosphatase